MKKRHIDDVLRAASELTGEKEFVIVGTQSLHGRFPKVPEALVRSAEVDLIATRGADRLAWLNALGQGSPFHEKHGYYADPMEEATVKLPKGWRSRLIELPRGESGEVRGACLDPHDLAISKYVARREKDLQFTKALARRGYISRRRLLELLKATAVAEETRARIREDIARDFEAEGADK
jgi:hypothetical protein